MSTQEENDSKSEYNWQLLADLDCTPAEFLLMIVSGEAEYPENEFLHALHMKFVEEHPITSANSTTGPVSKLNIVPA